ncbi:MAG: hypothetical protein HYX92_05340 [Chloroflexi bacterium]|nr:hypothetical protein [Chloroflexota bacterium]
MVISGMRTTVLSPRAEKFHTAARSLLAAQLKGLAGKSVCVVDNRRPNAEPLMDAIAQILSRDYAPGKVTRIRKDPRPGAPVSIRPRADRLSPRQLEEIMHLGAARPGAPGGKSERHLRGSDRWPGA